MGLAEVAELLDVTPSRLSMWRKRGTHDVPSALVELLMGPIWYEVTIVEWATRRCLIT
jgi:hypothetical protein